MRRTDIQDSIQPFCIAQGRSLKWYGKGEDWIFARQVLNLKNI